MSRDVNAFPAPSLTTGATGILFKVCGVTLPLQGAELRRLEVDLLGLNFHPASPRMVDIQRAREIIEAWGAPASVVGVFVDRSASEVLAICKNTGVGIAQLHGDETPRTVAEVARVMPVIRAFRLKDEFSLESARLHLDEIHSMGVSVYAALIDGYAADAHGGTGVAVGETLVKSASTLHDRLILAGGLKPENLLPRLGWVRPWAVDVASGVEILPGVKDLEKVVAMKRVILETLGTF